MPIDFSKDSQMKLSPGPGGQGYYMKRDNRGERCGPNEWNKDTGIYNETECVFDLSIKNNAAGVIGSNIHTLKQERGTDSDGLPTSGDPMWVHYDLQNTCDTTDVNTCDANTNCDINSNMIVPGTGSDHDTTEQGIRRNYLYNTYKGGQNRQIGGGDKDYWVGKWTPTDDICSWEGVKCSDSVWDNGTPSRYITNIGINNKYFNDPASSVPPMCVTKDKALEQNEWVNAQNTSCNSLDIDRACSDNQFCKWTDSDEACWNVADDTGINTRAPQYITESECEAQDKHEWKVGERKIPQKYNYYDQLDKSNNTKVGTCSLEDKYKKLSGLRKDDEFKTKTMGDILGEINNGRVSDANLTSNVKHTRRGEVLMQQDNQETSIKGVVEGNALNTIFFSEINTNIIQQTLRYKVYQKTQLIVDYQSPEALYIVMRSILLQHGNFRTFSDDLAQEIQSLNYMVINYCVKEVSSNVLQYKGYIKDLEQMPAPIDRPAFNDSSSRNRAYDMSRHIAPSYEGGWGFRHRSS